MDAFPSFRSNSFKVGFSQKGVTFQSSFNDPQSRCVGCSLVKKKIPGRFQSNKVRLLTSIPMGQQNCDSPTSCLFWTVVTCRPCDCKLNTFKKNVAFLFTPVKKTQPSQTRAQRYQKKFMIYELQYSQKQGNTDTLIEPF